MKGPVTGLRASAVSERMRRHGTLAAGGGWSRCSGNALNPGCWYSRGEQVLLVAIGAAQPDCRAARVRARQRAEPEHPLPVGGPYDVRLGYADLPELTSSASAREAIAVDAAGAPVGAPSGELIERGAFPIYREKTQAGLTLLDHRGAADVRARAIPSASTPDFEAVPPLVVDTPAVHREPRAARCRPRRGATRRSSGTACARSCPSALAKLRRPGRQAAPAAARSPPRSRSTATRRSAAPTTPREAAPDGLGEPARLSRRPRDHARRGARSWSTTSTRRRSARAPASARSTASATGSGPGSAATSTTPTGSCAAAGARRPRRWPSRRGSTSRC